MTYEVALQALADPTRRSIFEQLRRGPLPVGRLAESLPVSRPAVSQHLKVLKEAGLVKDTSEGTRRIYAADRQGIEELRRYVEGLWTDVLDAFKAEAEATRPRRRRPRRNDGR